MKKTLVIIIAVAILGGAGIYTKSHKSAASTGSRSNSSAASQIGTAAASSQSSGYKDGTYTGAAEETAYGTVQVAAVISGGKITDIKFLQMPGPEEHSKEVTAFSKQPLKASALSKQNAGIDFVSGATQTSEGYQQSLQRALDQAS